MLPSQANKGKRKKSGLHDVLILYARVSRTHDSIRSVTRKTPDSTWRVTNATQDDGAAAGNQNASGFKII